MKYVIQERDLYLRMTLTELRISVPSSIRFADSLTRATISITASLRKKVHRRTYERQAWLRTLYSASPRKEQFK